MPAQACHTRASLIALLENARAELLASIEGLTEEQMLIPLPDGWSVKDILAHVAMWDEMELPDMRRAARGDKPALRYSDYSWVDQWNQIQFALRKPFGQQQVLTELAEARRAITDFLGSVPDGLLSTGYSPTACAVQARHDRDHAGQVRAWRGEQAI